MTSPPTDPTHAQTVRFYDVEADRYDHSRYASAGGRRVDAFHKAVLEQLLFSHLRPDARVLELGCGTGRLLVHFAPRFAGLEGIDASDGMLRAAERRAPPDGRLSLVHGSAYALPYAPASFDAAYSILVINLLADFPAVFRELGRVLRPGARLVFNVPNLYSIYWPGGALVNLRGRTTGSNRAGARHSHWFTRSEVVATLRDAGFAIADALGQPPLLGRGLLTQALPGTAPWSLLCKSLYVAAERA
ncbi:MAG: class I SAM-dependent methyltransferase [Pseudomonadota bacterium]